MSHAHDGHPHADDGHAQAHAHAGALPELLDLDAEVLHAYLSSVTAWVADHVADQPVRRVLDTGAGTGTGTLALLDRFPGVEVLAVDLSAAGLDHLAERARQRGDAARVGTVLLDLEGDWPDLGTFDLVWAASSLHHVADPGRVLRYLRELLRPGGLLAVTETASFPLFLAGTADAALEQRCHAALARARSAHVPHQGSDWGAWLSGAGCDVVAARVFSAELDAPLPAAARRYAQLSLAQARTGLAGLVSPEDEAALEQLVEGLPDRADLSVRATRSGWLARRP